MTKMEKEDVGGNYFHIKKKNKIITSGLRRDCKLQNVNCDYELIKIKDGVLEVGPILGSNWITEELYDMWLEEGETEMTKKDFDSNGNALSIEEKQMDIEQMK